MSWVTVILSELWNSYSVVCRHCHSNDMGSYLTKQKHVFHIFHLINKYISTNQKNLPPYAANEIVYIKSNFIKTNHIESAIGTKELLINIFTCAGNGLFLLRVVVVDRAYVRNVWKPTLGRYKGIIKINTRHDTWFLSTEFWNLKTRTEAVWCVYVCGRRGGGGRIGRAFGSEEILKKLGVGIWGQCQAWGCYNYWNSVCGVRFKPTHPRCVPELFCFVPMENRTVVTALLYHGVWAGECRIREMWQTMESR